jgi:hypothetical protein
MYLTSLVVFTTVYFGIKVAFAVYPHVYHTTYPVD